MRLTIHHVPPDYHAIRRDDGRWWHGTMWLCRHRAALWDPERLQHELQRWPDAVIVGAGEVMTVEQLALFESEK